MTSNSSAQRWSIVLAGGSGTRLSSLTTVETTTVPKQFCGLAGGPSLLRLAMRRAAAVATLERTVVVAADEHRRWWRSQLADLPARNVLVQPRDRGTAAGILLSLIEILRRDPGAVVTMFPADHHVRREGVLAEAVVGAIALAEHEADCVVLVGVRPMEPDGDLGWILPRRDASAAGGSAVTSPVAEFREKPPPHEAARILRSGGLVNTFILAATARGLFDLCARHVPETVAALAAPGRPQLTELYASLPSRDLSRDVLARAPGSLRVVAAGSCGWSDLGTPQRVARCLDAMPPSATSRTRVYNRNDCAALDLAIQLGRAGLEEIRP